MFANDSFAGFCYGIECEHKGEQKFKLKIKIVRLSGRLLIHVYPPSRDQCFEHYKE